MWRVSRLDFYAAAIALRAVLLLGILQGILLAAVASVVLLVARDTAACRLSRPHSRHAYLLRPDRHPDNEPIPGVLAFRPEASLIYVNADTVLESVLAASAADKPTRSGWWCAICRLHRLSILAARRCCTSCRPSLLREIQIAHRRRDRGVRDLLRADKLDEKVGELDQATTLERLLGSAGR